MYQPLEGAHRTIIMLVPTHSTDKYIRKHSSCLFQPSISTVMIHWLPLEQKLIVLLPARNQWLHMSTNTVL